MTDLVLDCPLTSDSGANSAMAMTVETVARNLCIIVPSRPVRAWLSRGIGCPSQSGQTDWGFRLREARNKHSRCTPSRISVSATS